MAQSLPNVPSKWNSAALSASLPNHESQLNERPAARSARLHFWCASLCVLLYGFLPLALFGAQKSAARTLPKPVAFASVVTATPAALVAPAQGSTLSGSSVTFSWTPASNAKSYILYLGTTGLNSRNLFGSGSITATSVVVNGLPQTASTIYARLYWQTSSGSSYTDYTFIEAGSPGPPVLISPAPGSSLSGASTFSWTAGTNATAYKLYLGTTGVNSRNLYSSGSTTATAEAVTGLPLNGATVYARLYWEVAGSWLSADYTFSEGVATPVVTGFTCTNSSMTGTGTDACAVTLNTAAGASGFMVALASSNASVTLPASVTVPEGATSAGFSAVVSAVSTTQAATLTAAAGTSSQSFALQLNAVVPTLNLSTASLSFGSLSVNTPSTQLLTLTSTGTAAVTVNSAALSGAGFSVSGVSFPLTLSPNQSATLTVQFNPTAAGAATGTLTVTSNSSANPTAVVSLTGAGVPVLSGIG